MRVCTNMGDVCRLPHPLGDMARWLLRRMPRDLPAWGAPFLGGRAAALEAHAASWRWLDTVSSPPSGWRQVCPGRAAAPPKKNEQASIRPLAEINQPLPRGLDRVWSCPVARHSG